MNKKGVGIIGAIMLFIVFLIMYFVWLGKFLGEIGNALIVENGITGIEAFFLANLNLTVFVIMILGMMGFAYFGGGNQ